jgi:hypothetical protein
MRNAMIPPPIDTQEMLVMRRMRAMSSFYPMMFYSLCCRRNAIMI